MAIEDLLEDFGDYAAGAPLSISDVSLEEQRLAAFEKGYQAGWDDAVKAQVEGQRHVSSELAQNLQDLSFTYQEAYSALIKALSPLLTQIFETVLPRAAHDTLGLRLSGMLLDMAREHGEQPVEIVTAPESVAVIESVLTGELPVPVSVVEDSSLAGGQVHIRVGSAEREIDMSEVLREIERAMSGFIEENQKEIA